MKFDMKESNLFVKIFDVYFLILSFRFASAFLPCAAEAIANFFLKTLVRIFQFWIFSFF